MHELGLLAQPAAEDATGVLLELVQVGVRLRSREPQQEPGTAGHADGAGPGGHQNQPVDPLGEGPGQLLRHGPAEAHAQDVGALDADRIEDSRCEPGESPNRVGPLRHGGRTDAGRVEGDRA